MHFWKNQRGFFEVKTENEVLCLLTPYLYNPFFILSLIFLFISHITSFTRTRLLFIHFLGYLSLFSNDNLDEENK